MNINNIYVGKSIFTRVAAIAIALLIGTSVMAQQPVQKQINQIKRNAATYLFNEATHESEAEALQLAHELLMHDVQEYIKESPTLRQASNAIIKDIQSKVLSLTMMRGDMHRVFVYVKKSDIEGVSNVTVINQASGATITISDTPEPVINVQQPAAPAAPVTPVLPATPAAPATPVVQASPATPAAPATPTTPNTPTPAAPVNTPVQTTPTPAPAATPSTPNTPNIPGELAGWQRDAIASLLECSDVAAVKARLNRLKSEYRIKRYGNADKCPSPNESYWVIFNPDGTLHTILGTGADQRIDFRTNQTTTLQTYQGWSVLWFTLAK